jgi:hypothetical protein
MTGHEVGAALGVAVLSAAPTTASSLTARPEASPVLPRVRPAAIVAVLLAVVAFVKMPSTHVTGGGGNRHMHCPRRSTGHRRYATYARSDLPPGKKEPHEGDRPRYLRKGGCSRTPDIDNPVQDTYGSADVQTTTGGTRWVCVVGASGKLGQYMVQHALDRGYEVVGVGRQESVGKLDRFKGRITVIPGATDDPEVIKGAVAGCDGVLVVMTPIGVNGYSTGTTQAVLDYAPPGAERSDLSRIGPRNDHLHDPVSGRRHSPRLAH